MIKLRTSIKPIKGIYGIINKETKKIYIGSAENVRARLSHHFCLLQAGKHNDKVLQEDFNLIGIDKMYPVVFRYLSKNHNKLKMEELILTRFINKGFQVYNYIMPYRNKYFKLADKTSARYVIVNKLLKRTYINVLSITDFYKRNKCYNCPSPAKLYSMLANNEEYNNWTIALDTTNTAEEVLVKRASRLGSTYKTSKYYNTYKRIIHWEITNIKTNNIEVIENLMAWCTKTSINYNQFQRYKDTDRVYKEEWKLRKL